MTDLLDWTPPIEDRPAYNENGWRDIASEFKKFHRKNPEIFKLFTRFSNEAKGQISYPDPHIDTASCHFISVIRYEVVA